jgi:hypothetical protein
MTDEPGGDPDAAAASGIVRTIANQDVPGRQGFHKLGRFADSSNVDEHKISGALPIRKIQPGKPVRT